MIQFKFTQELLQQMKNDLQRVHDFALERVGFLTVKTGKENKEIQLVLGSQYYPVADQNYIDDPKVGAKINSNAIREVMQRILTYREGAFHVHLHDHFGQPTFSRRDLIELPKLIDTFRNVGSHLPHGALLLSNNEMSALIWLPGQSTPVKISKISVIGYPIQVFGGGYYV
jgi:hypothetical protein